MRAALAIVCLLLLLPVPDARAESMGRWIFGQLFGNPASSCERSLMPGRSVELGSGFRRWRMPATSMLPTIRADELVLSMAPAKGRMWRRGDVVIFKLPRNVKVTYLMRIVALAGDTVEMRAGRLYLNGKQVVREGPLPRKAAASAKECVARDGREFTAKMFREHLPGGWSLRILECSDNEPATDNTRTFKVPRGHVFALGDNRDNALDSRFRQVGMVPESLITGLVVCVLKR